MAKIAYVTGNQGKTQFEIHGAGCAHLQRLHPWADVTIHETETVAEFIAAEVEEFDYNEQGWTAEDFHVLPCALKAEGK